MNNKRLTAADFPDMYSLARWLHENSVDISTWNIGEAKGIDSLWRELQRGETTLTTNPVQRNVRVVGLLIERGDKVLMEVCQKMHDGRTRQRALPPSEKLFVGESAEHGARRCLQEELDVEGRDVTLHQVGIREYERDSPSYPGISSAYTMYYMGLTLPDLPDEDFTIPNRGLADSVVSHTWGWRPRQAHLHF